MSNRMMELREELAAHKTGGRSPKRARTDTPRQVLKGRLDDRERLAHMEERGEIKLGTGKIPGSFWSKPRPKDPEGAVLDALLDQRDSDY